MSASDTTYRLLYAEEYSTYDFNYTVTTKTNAKDVFLLFARFEDIVLGHDEFEIKDTRLFGFNTRPPTRASLRFTEGTGCETCSAYQMPEYWEICVTYSGPNCNCPSSYEVCDMCYTCAEELCIYGWSIGGGDVSGDGWDDGDPWEGEGGGGVPNENWWDEECEEDPSGIGRYVPCDGVVGWQPISNEQPYILFGAAHFDTWQISLQDAIKVDFWKSNNLDTTGLDSCRKLVLIKLIETVGSSPLGNFLSKLDRAIGEDNTIDKFKLHFILRPLSINESQVENSSYNPITKEYEADIVFDSTIAVSSTDLYIAQSFIHEIVHAYLSYIWRKIYEGTTTVQLDSLKYDSVFNAYVDTLRMRDSLNTSMAGLFSESYQHNFMADQLLEYMAEILEKFDNSSISNKRYYWYLAWSGLTRPHTKTWKLHWPNYPNWPPSNPSPNIDSTRGLKYALTLSRIDSIYNKILHNERTANISALGNPPIVGGCY
jgi:hypothetical protein